MRAKTKWFAQPCHYCGTPFESYPSSKRRYCSLACKGKGLTLPKPSAEEKARLFWSHVWKTETCWLWQGSLLPERPGQLRYGRLHIIGLPALAHRASYTLIRGAIPSGMVVMHTCDTPQCVRPDHLRVATQRENVRDAMAKGRFWSRK
jgi:hypothetical protein